MHIFSFNCNSHLSVIKHYLSFTIIYKYSRPILFKQVVCVFRRIPESETSGCFILMEFWIVF